MIALIIGGNLEENPVKKWVKENIPLSSLANPLVHTTNAVKSAETLRAYSKAIERSSEMLLIGDTRIRANDDIVVHFDTPNVAPPLAPLVLGTYVSLAEAFELDYQIVFAIYDDVFRQLHRILPISWQDNSVFLNKEKQNG